MGGNGNDNGIADKIKRIPQAIWNTVNSLTPMQKNGVLVGIVAVCVVIVGMAVFSVIKGTDSNLGIKDPVQAVAKPQEDEEPEEEAQPQLVLKNEVDFDRLRELINGDIYAWIYAPGSNINYPILRSHEGQDTDYYLEHNYNGSSGLPGCIYSQLRNSPDFTDRDTVLYGHDMANGTMFRTVHSYENADFFNTNKYIYIYTPTKVHVYKTAACFAVDDRLILSYYNDFKDDAVWNKYLQDIRTSGGNQDTSVELNMDDRLLTLSTCIGSRPDMRQVLISKELDEAEIAALGNDAERDAAAITAANGQRTLTGDPPVEDTQPQETAEAE